MADFLVDSNVLIIGSAGAGVEPKYTDVVVDADGIEIVFNWLVAFRDDTTRKLVLDDMWRIFEEYNNKLNGQHFGLQVVHHKLQACMRTVPVFYDHDGYGIVPSGLSAVDKSDKKFVAAALNDPANIHIVNAGDSDWKQHEAALEAHGIVVLELLT